MARWGVAALLIAVALTGNRTASCGQVVETSSGRFSVVPFGGSNGFFDPVKYGIYCASLRLLDAADAYAVVPPWRAVADFRTTMEAWRENPRIPSGRAAGDFVIYLRAGTAFQVLFAPPRGERQNPRYKIRIEGGPFAGRTCWTSYE